MLYNIVSSLVYLLNLKSSFLNSVKVNKKNRRETWCGPAMRNAMRQSFGGFLKPSKVDVCEVTETFTTKETFSKEAFDEHLRDEEDVKLVEIVEEQEDNWMKPSPSPVARKKRKTVNFVQSPKFLSPRRSFFSSTILDTTDDGGTPKAVIRDKFKRVSLALSSRETELEREKTARMEAEFELQVCSK